MWLSKLLNILGCSFRIIWQLDIIVKIFRPEYLKKITKDRTAAEEDNNNKIDTEAK